MNAHHVRPVHSPIITIQQTITVDRYVSHPATPPEPPLVTIGRVEKKALRQFCKRFRFRCRPELMTELFLVTALAFQKELYPAIDKWVLYCESEGVSPGLESLRDVILNNTRKPEAGE